MWHRNLALQALRQVEKRVGDVTYKSFVLNVLRVLADQRNCRRDEAYCQSDIPAQGSRKKDAPSGI
jgi:hypothetical protein